MLIIFELANNHCGNLQHGLDIINSIYEVSYKYDDVFDLAFKFQYRSPDFCHGGDEYADNKYVKRFNNARLAPYDQEVLIKRIKDLGYKLICTPFDEVSVGIIEEQGFYCIKIASCSLTDWPLLDRIVQSKLPVIASTAGSTLDAIDKVVQVFKHRNKDISLMHCVGEYPTPHNHLELNQIDLLKKRYPDLNVGFSTHEHPNNYDAVKIAVAKGVTILERHVDVLAGGFETNGYSSTPHQISLWLAAIEDSLLMCGRYDGKRYEPSDKELADLHQFKRGAYALHDIQPGEKLTEDNTYFAFPNVPNQLVANDFSKYTEFKSDLHVIKTNDPIFYAEVSIKDSRDQLLKYVDQVGTLLAKSHIQLNGGTSVDLSHHYGLNKFEQFGTAIVNILNREYCKKLLIVLPGQQHPMHFHKIKEETFHVLYGDMRLHLVYENDRKIDHDLVAGDLVTIARGTKHSFTSDTGLVLEEISTTHIDGDSFYDDLTIMENKERKTKMTFWPDWVNKEI